MRRYDDPVQVRRGRVHGHPGCAPERFCWRGRWWRVRAVLAHWVATGAWWSSPGARAVIGTGAAVEDVGASAERGPGADLLREQETWRVEASDAAGATGGFELVLGSDGWRLVGCLD